MCTLPTQKPFFSGTQEHVRNLTNFGLGNFSGIENILKKKKNFRLFMPPPQECFEEC